MSNPAFYQRLSITDIIVNPAQHEDENPGVRQDHPGILDFTGTVDYLKVEFVTPAKQKYQGHPYLDLHINIKDWDFV